MIDEIFKALRQDGKTLASQMKELEGIVNENVPKEHRHLIPNFGKMRKALQDKDPNAALEIVNKAKASLKKVQDIDKDQTK
jgi:hypothetical protein